MNDSLSLKDDTTNWCSIKVGKAISSKHTKLLKGRIVGILFLFAILCKFSIITTYLTTIEQVNFDYQGIKDPQLLPSMVQDNALKEQQNQRLGTANATNVQSAYDTNKYDAIVTNTIQYKNDTNDFLYRENYTKKDMNSIRDDNLLMEVSDETQNSSIDRAEEIKTLPINNEPVIDAVFTYVNGSDPDLISIMTQYGKVNPARIRDFGQLRYAMRSVFMNAPFVRNLIVVVSNKHTQTPSWLDTTYPRVRVVEHQEIWENSSYLPSMNSEAIEWALLNIKGLAPLYLYFNDDFAIQTKLNLSSIWPGHDQYVVWNAWEAPREENQVGDTYGKSLAFVRKLFDQRYGKIKDRKVASHVPILFDRLVLEKIKQDFPSVIEDMFREKPFRTNHGMQMQFAYQQYIRHHYSYRNAPDHHMYFHELNVDYEKNAIKFNTIKNNPRQFICLQDGFGINLHPSEHIVQQIRSFYEDLFPAKAPWEKDG